MTTASWRSDFCDALSKRDAYHHSTQTLYSAYTRLADRATHSTGVSPPLSLPVPASTAISASSSTSKTPNHLNPKIQTVPNTPTTTTTTRSMTTELTTLRTALSTSQTSRASLTTQLATQTRTHIALSTTHASLETSHRSQTHANRRLTIKVSDRDAELVAKRKLLEEVQDEVLSLTMQLNLAEERCGKVEGENRELVRRLVGVKEREAEEMNRLMEGPGRVG